MGQQLKQSAVQSQSATFKMKEVVLLGVNNSSIAPEDESGHSQRADAGALLAFSRHKLQESSSSYYDEEDGSSEKEKTTQKPENNCLLF